MSQNKLFKFLKDADEEVLSYLDSSSVTSFFAPAHISDGTWSYIKRPAKRLRPAVLLMACGSVGGDIEKAIPAAAGVEVYHTWTLVHDDIIDNDNLRRGLPTVHSLTSAKGSEEMGLIPEKANKYGESVAILVGDLQQGWAINLFIDSALDRGVDSKVVLRIVAYLQSYVLANLIRGEALDIQYGLLDDVASISLSEDEVLEMLWLKTGILYEFAGMAGAMIGLDCADFENPEVRALKNFTANCGIAFQLQDDILGLVGSQEETGKPVGSDVREGKKTIIVLEGIKNASLNEQRKVGKILGNQNASPEEILEVVEILRARGGVKRCSDLANIYIDKALPFLEDIPESKYKELLYSWAEFMINRNF